MTDFPDAPHDPVWLLNYPQSWFAGAATAVVLTGLATIMKFALNAVETNSLLFATYFPALAMTTLLSGKRWGYLAVIMSFLTAQYLFVEPYLEFGPLTRHVLVNALVFGATGLMLVEICSAYRRALMRLQRKRAIIAEEHARAELMARELQHRSKNAATIMASLVRKSLPDEPEKAETILGRLRALHTVDLLEKTIWGRVGLRDLLAKELALIEPSRLFLSGPNVTVTAHTGRSLALILHELSTNAAKYGALTRDQGVVKISWSFAGHVGRLVWEEVGGPAITAQPTRKGFGTVLIDRLVAERGARIEREFRAEGLCVKILFETREFGLE